MLKVLKTISCFISLYSFFKQKCLNGAFVYFCLTELAKTMRTKQTPCFVTFSYVSKLGWMEGGTKSYFLVIQKQRADAGCFLKDVPGGHHEGWKGGGGGCDDGEGGYSRGKHLTKQWTVARQLLKQGLVTTGQLPVFPVTLSSVSKWRAALHKRTRKTHKSEGPKHNQRRSTLFPNKHYKLDRKFTACNQNFSQKHKLFGSHTNVYVWLLKAGFAPKCLTNGIFYPLQEEDATAPAPLSHHWLSSGEAGMQQVTELPALNPSDLHQQHHG